MMKRPQRLVALACALGMIATTVPTEADIYTNGANPVSRWLHSMPASCAFVPSATAYGIGKAMAHDYTLPRNGRSEFRDVRAAVKIVPNNAVINRSILVTVHISSSSEDPEVNARVSLNDFGAALVPNKPICGFANLFKQSYDRELSFPVVEESIACHAASEFAS